MSPGPARSGWPVATSAHLLGAAVVIVGDMQKDRLAQAAGFGCETIDLSAHDDLREQLQQILGGAGGVERRRGPRRLRGPRPRRRGLPGRGPGDGAELNHGHHPGGRAARDPGLYVTGDPGAVDEPAKVGSLSIRIPGSAGPSPIPSPPASAR